MIEIRNLTELGPPPRERALSVICRMVVHRIDFSADDGGGYWGDVDPIPRNELDGYGVALRFFDKRQVPDQDRLTRGGKDVEWRDRPGAWTGGHIPYTFVGKAGGGVDQLLELSDFGPHARRWSWSGLSYALAGDFRKDEPTPEQWRDVVEMAALFIAWTGQGALTTIFGHTELPGGSSDPTKRCPGAMLDMDKLRHAAADHELTRLCRDAARERMVEMGVVF